MLRSGLRGAGRVGLVVRLVFVAVLLASVGLNVLLLQERGAPSASSADSQHAKYPFLSARIFAERQNDVLINFTPLRNAMREYVSQQEVQMGVYFEYLPSGTSIGINDQMEVKLASLIKVPVVMAVYKEIEDGRLSLDAPLAIEERNLDARFGDLYKEGAGGSMTVREAIRLTLVKSDNTAASVLATRLGQEPIIRIFDALDLPKLRDNEFVVLSPKNYSSILRSLYLSSYLRREDSHAILKLLSETDFNDKIPAGVPSTVPVAHKIGVFKATTNGGEQTEQIFNDCGIVYAPSRPYSLCIMVVGDEDTARKHMQLISKMVYGYIEKVQH